MREILLFIMPVPILFYFLLATIIFYRMNQRRRGKIMLWIAGLWFLVTTTAPVPQVLVQSFENQYSQISNDVLKKLTGSCNILVLGSGHSDDKSLSPNNQLGTTALERLVEGIRIKKMIPHSKLILSGYGYRSELSHALVLYRTALSLGVDSASMSTLPLPSDTRMEADEYIRNFGNKDNLILVTSSIHMPRAMTLFKKAGLNPVPAPTAFIIKHESQKYPGCLVPSSRNVMMMEEIMYAYVGMIWSWMGCDERSRK
ncbi:MAG: YdcF family protein [Ignavibacteriales bacterium]|nr:YdcF family protein [Ignavibacteriales bacterium]